MLKAKFQKLHLTIVDNVNAAKIIDFLFAEGVLAGDDMSRLMRYVNPQQQCRDLLALLHTSAHSQAFVKLYHAISNEGDLHWLTDSIDEFNDQSVIDLMQRQCRLDELTGNVCFHRSHMINFAPITQHSSTFQHSVNIRDVPDID